MNITLNINSQDYGFIIEAIKLRTIALVESLEMDKQTAEQAAREDHSQAKAEINKMVDGMFEQELEKFKKQSVIVEKPKKPHWTQTEKGKKIMAARRRRGAKK
jgi:hypothetical protein